MNSILNFPERGNYGKSNYRGNCSGHIQRELIEHFNPNFFIDVCEGGGTSKDVCLELDVDYLGLDLHKGFDFTKNSVLNIANKEADIVFSHPPYHNMINYEKERLKHNLFNPSGNDLSNCGTVEEFLELCQIMLLNQREATKSKGIYTTLIGDYRKSGKFYSFQSDLINMLPKNELLSVVIKMQHNTMSSFKNYSSKNFIPISHEYLIVWKKIEASIYDFLENKIKEVKNLYNTTWKNIVKLALINNNNQADLNSIYSAVLEIAPERVQKNKNYKAKVRQVLQLNFTSIERGVWTI